MENNTPTTDQPNEIGQAIHSFLQNKHALAESRFDWSELLRDDVKPDGKTYTRYAIGWDNESGTPEAIVASVTAGIDTALNSLTNPPKWKFYDMKIEQLGRYGHATIQFMA